MDLTPDLLSRYADGEISPEEARSIEEELGDDPSARAVLEEFRGLGAIFGEVSPEPCSDGLMARLAALRPVPAQVRFEVVKSPAVRRRAWFDWGAAAAAMLLLGFGLVALLHRPEVVLQDFARQTLDDAGRVVSTEHHERFALRSGDLLRTEGRERLSYRMPDGSVVVLMPEGALSVGSPDDGLLFDLERGTVLCTVYDQGKVRQARAGAYRVHADGADFGIRMEGHALKSSGPSLSGGPDVTVAVSRGQIEVGENGDRQTVGASERLTLRPGAAVRRSKAWRDPIYLALMRRVGRELVPGYFDHEAGVLPIASRSWSRAPDGSLVHVLSDVAAAGSSRYLVLEIAAEGPCGILVTRLSPYRDASGLALAATVRVSGPGVVAIPLDAFDAEGTVQENREVPASRSGLMRIELRPEDRQAPFVLKGSLWAAHPPAEDTEVVR